MTTLQEALPCPFCGSSEGLDYRDGSTHRWGIASCVSCGASSGETRREYPDVGEWHYSAMKQWNTRSALAQQGEPIGYFDPEGLAELQHCNGMSVWAESSAAHEDAPKVTAKHLVPLYTAAPVAQQGEQPVAWWITNKTTDEKFVTTRPGDWNSVNWSKHPLYTAAPAPVAQQISKAQYNRVRDDYNELLKKSERDALDGQKWRDHVSRCQFAQVDTDHSFSAPAPQPVGINGLTEAETSASMSVRGLSKPTPPGYGELIRLAAWMLSPDATRHFDSLEENSHIGHRQFSKAQQATHEAFRNKAVEIRKAADAIAALQSAQPVAAHPDHLPDAGKMVPLTGEEIYSLVRDKIKCVPLPYDIQFARAIEAAHGIKEGK